VNNGATAEPDLAGYEPAGSPIWLEALFPLDWIALHASPVYYGFGVPRGHGEPVILVPGFLGDDRYLTEMHLWLRRVGYRPYFSGIGKCGLPGADAAGDDDQTGVRRPTSRCRSSATAWAACLPARPRTASRTR
jgi:hypothetical protein